MCRLTKTKFRCAKCFSLYKVQTAEKQCAKVATKGRARPFSCEQRVVEESTNATELCKDCLKSKMDAQD
ncbi:hypothetical protein ACJ41O_014540 [Fusarium nematophilum]